MEWKLHWFSQINPLKGLIDEVLQYIESFDLIFPDPEGKHAFRRISTIAKLVA